MKEIKPLEVRLREVKELYTKLDSLGIPPDLEGIRAFRAIANDYVKDGIGHSGVIPIREIQRILRYKFPLHPEIPCDVTLSVMR